MNQTRTDLTHLRWLLPFALFAFGFTVRLFQAGHTPFSGDEISVFRESERFTNPNGILYFVLMRFWLSFSHDLLWIRLPSILFGALAVSFCFLWLRVARNEHVALIAAVLFCLSSMAVEYSQEVRFYALLMFSACLFLWSYWRLLKVEERTRKKFGAILVFGVASLLLLGSHILGILMAGFTAIHWLYYCFPPISKRKRVFGLVAFGLLLLGLAIVIFAPGLVQVGYQIMRGLNGSPTPGSYEGGRGLTFITAGKLALLYHFFTLGQFVHPLELTLTIPALLITGLALLTGVFALFRNSDKKPFGYAILVGGGSIFALYIVFDALWPPSSRDSAGPRYVIFVLPIFLWVCAEGVNAIRNFRLRTIGVTLLIGIQLIGLANTYYPDWNAGYKANDFARPAAAIQKTAAEMPLRLFVDGRASGTMAYYINNTPVGERVFSLADMPELETLTGATAFVSLDDRFGNQCNVSPILSALSSRPGQEEVIAWVNFSLFAYVYRPRTSPALADGMIRLPRALFPSQFADLRLPQMLRWNDQSLTIGGVFLLPGCASEKQFAMAVQPFANATKIVLFSNLLPPDTLRDGEQIAELTLISPGGQQLTYPIRKGIETQVWDKRCKEGCQPALFWHKRAALVGGSAYPGAYQDFQAAIFGIEFPIPSTTQVTGLELRAVAETRLFIWGLRFQ